MCARACSCPWVCTNTHTHTICLCAWIRTIQTHTRSLPSSVCLFPRAPCFSKAWLRSKSLGAIKVCVRVCRPSDHGSHARTHRHTHARTRTHTACPCNTSSSSTRVFAIASTQARGILHEPLTRGSQTSPSCAFSPMCQRVKWPHPSTTVTLARARSRASLSV